ncbi:Hypothetical Protein SLY_0906 [Strawberry lethal yellows phytoplasma (CPA) str. NZSb11]|uniref:DUF2963 domain-containing protein n=2 Tax=Phytoplasma australiense TaxID=59748 RepID=R4RQN3_PHYAS|nr:Hypothetical Protein SLY_0906 [Strawberry lethal yellows phytoplasma (CPA) str. NZSb11]
MAKKKGIFMQSKQFFSKEKKNFLIGVGFLLLLILTLATLITSLCIYFGLANKTNNKTPSTHYNSDDLKTIAERYPISSKKIKYINYKKDTTIKDFFECNKRKGKRIKSIIYLNGAIDWISEYDKKTRKRIKSTHYKPDGKVDYSFEYDPETRNKIKYTNYNIDGTIKEILEYDKITNKRTKSTYYNKEGLVGLIFESDPQTGNITKSIYYNENGSIQRIYEYDPQTGNETK